MRDSATEKKGSQSSPDLPSAVGCAHGLKMRSARRDASQPYLHRHVLKCDLPMQGPRNPKELPETASAGQAGPPLPLTRLTPNTPKRNLESAAAVVGLLHQACSWSELCALCVSSSFLLCSSMTPWVRQQPPSTSWFIFAAWKNAARCHFIREYGKFLPAVMGRDPTLSADV